MWIGLWPELQEQGYGSFQIIVTETPSRWFVLSYKYVQSTENVHPDRMEAVLLVFEESQHIRMGIKQVQHSKDPFRSYMGEVFVFPCF